MTNRLATAIAAREAMREHRKGKPIAFSDGRCPVEFLGVQCAHRKGHVGLHQSEQAARYGA